MRFSSLNLNYIYVNNYYPKLLKLIISISSQKENIIIIDNYHQNNLFQNFNLYFNLLQNKE